MARGLVPSARSTARSRRPAASTRRMACPASTTAASAAISPSTAAAADSGRIARSPWPSTTEVTRKPSGDPGGSSRANSRWTAGTARSPRSSFSPTQA